MENLSGLSMLNQLQDATLEDYIKKKKENQKKKYHFDKLKMYFGEEHTISGVTIMVPKIGDILAVGEEKFYQAALPFTLNSTSIRTLLWDYFNKTDWNKVKDIEVYQIVSQMTVDKAPLKLFFKNIEFDDFQLVPARHSIDDSEYEELALYSPSQNILLYEDDYMEIAEYIREILNKHPKVEKAKGKTTVAWIIQEDKMNALSKNDDKSSTLLPLISACVNHPGFKYKLQDIKEMNIYQFMDSVKRIQKYENSIAALNGIYSGFRSFKDIDIETLNFMGDI